MGIDDLVEGTCRRNLTGTVKQELEFAGLCRGRVRGDDRDGSQDPRIWQGKDPAGSPGQHRASYEASP